MKLAVITGASRGLGAAIAEGFIDKGYGLITVSRQENEALKRKASESQSLYAHFNCDLASPDQQLSTLEAIIHLLQEWGTAEALYLINNAGVVEPIEVVGEMGTEDLQRLMTVNILAPMVMTNGFVKAFTQEKLTVVNVSSGAALHPTHGWSAYGSSKAAVNLFTETAALEAQHIDAPHTFIAYNPGIMDTEMQGVIRSSGKQAFKDVEKFQGFKENGQLRSPEVVAQALIDLLIDKDPENGRIYNVNELLDK
ncbi:benzil reductase ((S)-benzoin forming) [Pullulanibacillus pueri]|uniref:Benzil reductase ((S)-benzoin forming) n=1 Tax=Pullulanibacillus pueri TaxID=1437324 RepID=A0A8J3ELR6_9BACL|nr:(S)-benzoin forming benzil reductase [Pullulanibacillus pueri]MBM7681346.1 benzil reductase ((S)-benzoin forming) [Pullulanibacillus pueri]GGH77507.1 benzil reductase ((S)-benzoin forming) [Pullulanibacillus pueri]